MSEATDLARAFEELVRDVHVPPGLKDEAERRLRRRRAQRRGRIAAVALVMVGSLAAVVPVLIDRADSTDQSVTSDGQDGERADGARSEPGAVSVVLEGVHGGERWQLEAYDSADGLCVDLRYQGDASGGCGLDEARRVLGWMRGRRGGVEAVFGTARPNVATVDGIRASGETLTFTPVVHADRVEVAFYAFLVDATDPIMTVVARDASGAELAGLSLPGPMAQGEGSAETVTDWGDQMAFDDETGKIRAPGFNEFIDEQQPTWAETARGSALALIGQLTVGEKTEVTSEGNSTIVVTVTGLGDDSVGAVRYELEFSRGDDGLYRLEDGAWSQRCQPGRGHDQFLIDPCV